MRLLIMVPLVYFALIFWLRVAGKRTLSKWNAFDLVVTIAFGSLVASVILSKDISLSEGILALVLLIALQYILTWLSVRVSWVRNLIKADPTMLYYKGNFLRDTMQSQRVPEAEILSAVRNSNFASLEEIEAVVLETDGSFSVIKKLGDAPYSALSDVGNLDEAKQQSSDKEQKKS